MDEAKRIINRLDLGGCAVCGRPAYAIYGGGAVLLKDGSPVCGDCCRRVRFLYPVSYEKRGGNIARTDGMVELDLQELLAVMEAAPEKLEDMREAYGYHRAVMCVDSFGLEKRGLFKAPRCAFTGRVLYGKFNIGDKVHLTEGPCAAPGPEIEISGLSAPFLGGSAGEAGYSVTVYAEGTGTSAKKGALLVK